MIEFDITTDTIAGLFCFIGALGCAMMGLIVSIWVAIIIFFVMLGFFSWIWWEMVN